MKRNNTSFFAFLLVIVTTLSSCEVIGEIFKAGVWVGIIVVVLIVGIILWVIGKARK